MNDPRVKIVALASNEAYFLPQWVYHHFYFGFDAIDVYVNRICDNTIECLNKLTKIYPNLNYYNWDWLDLQLNHDQAPKNIFQEGAYAFSYLNSGKNFDYLLFIDIDEFFMPYNCEDSIKKCIVEMSFPDVILLRWYISLMQQEYVMPLLSKKNIPLYQHNSVKPLIKTNLPIKRINVHIPFLNEVSSLMDGNGKEIKISTFYSVPILNHSIDNYFILHDANRSWLTLLSKFSNGYVLSGNNRSELVPFLKYRFREEFCAENKYHYIFNNIISDKYLKGFKNLYKDNNLKGIITNGIKYHYLSAFQSFSLIKSLTDSENFDKFITIFGKTDFLYEKLLSLIQSFDESFKNITPPEINDINNLITPSKDLTVKNLISAIKFYPYHLFKSKPIFLSELVRYLTDKGYLNEARTILNNSALSKIEYSLSEWANLFFLNAYLKSDNLGKALFIYKKLRLCGNKDIINKMTELELLINKLSNRD